jgi:hypothetical protein
MHAFINVQYKWEAKLERRTGELLNYRVVSTSTTVASCAF